MMVKRALEDLGSYAKSSRDRAMMFWLWQSGRELFHSNMFAFLLEDDIYGATVANALAGQNIVSINNGNPSHEIRVLREKLNLDLIALLQAKNPKDDCYVIAVENKFKSIPDVAQLRKYDGKLEEQFPADTTQPNRRRETSAVRRRASFEQLWDEWSGGVKLNEDKLECQDVVLIKRVLVPTKKLFPTGTAWEAVLYADIFSNMRAYQPELTPSALGAYLDITSSTIAVIDALLTDLEGYPFINFSSDDLRQLTAVLRINDVVEKYRYEYLQFAWAEKLLAKPSILVQPPPVDPSDRKSYRRIGTYKKGTHEILVEVYSDFSRGTGMAGVELFPVGHDYSYGLQVQDGRLKVYVCLPGQNQHTDECRAAQMLAEMVANLGFNQNCFSGLKQRSRDRAGTVCSGLQISWVNPPNHGLLSYKQEIRWVGNDYKANKAKGWFFYVQTQVWGSLAGTNCIDWSKDSLDVIAGKLADLTVRLLDQASII